MATSTCFLTIWGVKRLIAPVSTLAAAAERLGQDVNAPPLSETGPLEIAKAARAFNIMSSRIHRFVTDRTQLLLAIGHDLRTPITRLKLRAEFIEDDALRTKFLADLDEIEAMIRATLAFGRDNARHEPTTALDIASLLETIIDEMREAYPDKQEKIVLQEPLPKITVCAKPLGLKRALRNLMENALLYGGNVRVNLQTHYISSHDLQDGEKVAILIEDDGPGLKDETLEQVFEPFFRIETSRNRATGGTGLGLSIARNIIRGQGGDIILQNRSPHGLCAIVTLIG